MLVLLDIDRTLMHPVERRFVQPEWKERFQTFEFDQYTVFLRPFLSIFLSYLFSLTSKGTKVGHFTAGSYNYATHVVKEVFEPHGYKLHCVFSNREYDESLDFDGRPKSVYYVAHKLKINVNEIILVDDSARVCNPNVPHSYKIPKFVVCTDYTNIFGPFMFHDQGLLECYDHLEELNAILVDSSSSEHEHEDEDEDEDEK